MLWNALVTVNALENCSCSWTVGPVSVACMYRVLVNGFFVCHVMVYEGFDMDQVSCRLVMVT